MRASGTACMLAEFKSAFVLSRPGILELVSTLKIGYTKSDPGLSLELDWTHKSSLLKP